MRIYFNWLGKWIELDNNDDTINDMSPDNFVQMQIPELLVINDSRKEEKFIPYIVQIRKQNTRYSVPITNIEWSENITKYTNEERW